MRMFASQFRAFKRTEAFSLAQWKCSDIMHPSRTNSRLSAGDLVAVRTACEILKTLDQNGTLDGLPFMPEMLEFCGKRFRVLNRVVQATVDGAFLAGHNESFVREFRNNDVVILKSARCSGAEHDGCQRGCSIF